MSGMANGFYKFADWATRLFYVNVLWMAFTLLGLVLFGLFPATAAMFAVIRKWNEGEDDIPVFKTFWESYKTEFIRVNILGWVLAILGYLIYIEFSILRTQDSVVYYIASFGVIAQLILYMVIVLYFFPIFVHFNLKMFDYLKWPFILGIQHPILTVFLTVVLNVLIFVTLNTLPVLAVLFGGSVIAFITMWGISKTFANYEQQEETA